MHGFITVPCSVHFGCEYMRTCHFALGIIQDCCKEIPLSVPLFQDIHRFRFLFQEGLHGCSYAVPPGYIITYLRPGKNPGDGPEVIKLQTLVTTTRDGT